MRDAIADAGLAPEQVRHPRTGVIAGSGGGSAQWQIETGDLLREKGVRKVGPFMVPRTMCSTVSATLATAFGILGLSYSIAAACATSAHCIGAAADLIRHGAQDIIFAGGGEELHWGMTAQFDAMGALSTGANHTPQQASRPYDVDRDGFVIAAGGGILVLEDYEHAKARGARIHAELVGYGVTSDGADMVAPSGEGAVRCMRMALANVDARIDYLNTHGTATPLGDIVELNAVRKVFGSDVPPLSSTKALTGHSLGAASVHEAIYSLLMLQRRFHGRLGPHHRSGRTCARLSDPAREPAWRKSYRDVQQLRFRRHQRQPGVRQGLIRRRAGSCPARRASSRCARRGMADQGAAVCQRPSARQAASASSHGAGSRPCAASQSGSNSVSA